MSKPATLPADWRAAIEHVEETLERSLASLRQREQFLQECQSTAGSPDGASARLEELRSKLASLEELANQAAGVVREVDADLAQGETAMEQWVRRSSHLNGTLAELLGPA